jgi:predicted short-subunit dehydrogenase-like oxidoreductase (DUF2520 family)
MNTLAIIGAGNLAASIAPAFKMSGIKIVGIYSRNYEHAVSLAERVDVQPVRSIQELGDAGFYLLSVADNCIGEIASQLPKSDAIVLHTSGSTNIDVLKPYCANYGALYPFQTFSAARPVKDFSSIPVYIEANSENTLMKLRELAGKISEKVAILDSEKRMGLHIAGVFSCNFVNNLLSCAFDICEKFGIDPQNLKPLVDETLQKAFSSGTPKAMQTGPAVRGDTATIEKHLNLLQKNPELQKIYQLISEFILMNSE